MTKKIETTKVKEMQTPAVNLKDVYDATPREHRQLMNDPNPGKPATTNIMGPNASRTK